jgi:hypothetical protein
LHPSKPKRRIFRRSILETLMLAWLGADASPHGLSISAASHAMSLAARYGGGSETERRTADRSTVVKQGSS